MTIHPSLPEKHAGCQPLQPGWPTPLLKALYPSNATAAVQLPERSGFPVFWTSSSPQTVPAEDFHIQDVDMPGGLGPPPRQAGHPAPVVKADCKVILFLCWVTHLGLAEDPLIKP